MTHADLRLAVRPRSWLLLVALTAVTATAHAQTPGGPAAPAKKPVVVTRTLPAPSGVRSEAQTVIDAPAEQVATLLSDPKNFVPLFPAHAVDVLERSPNTAATPPDTQVIAVEMRKPWPVGTVKWVEDVVTSRDADGKGFTVQRSAHPGYFKHMSARWRITPDPAAANERCIVTYEVAMELKQWAPELFLRRGNLNGIVDTMSRLRKLVTEHALAPGQTPAKAAAYQ